MQIEFLHSIDFIFYTILLIGILASFFLIKILFYKKWYRFLLFCRLILFSIILSLLLNPVLNISSNIEKKLDWHIYLDNSTSIKYHKTPSINSINSGLNQLNDQLFDKNISFKTFLFDEKIHSINNNRVNGNGISTNFGEIIESIIESENNLAGAIIISDGILTQGENSIESLTKTLAPIYTVGIGEDNDLVDISIHSLDVPTVVLKGDDVDLKVIIQSFGIIKERLNISLYRNSELLGSKPIQLLGKGSKNEVNFRFNSKEIGRHDFEVRVSSLEDEINIQNNRQNFSLLILKDKYKVALITGSPNKNTTLIKKIIKGNKRIDLDHFIRIKNNNFVPEMKLFWETPYELIVFDNYPIKPLSPNFIRILGKKILINQSGIMLLAGPNQNNKSLNGVNSIFGFTLADSIESSENVFWDFIGFFNNNVDLPPLTQSLYINSKGSFADSLAIFESGWPLWLRNENKNIRSTIFSTSELGLLYHIIDKESNSNVFSSIINSEVNWLLKTGGSNENYFRLNKDYFQQGEMIYITGNEPFKTPLSSKSILFKVFHKNENRFSSNIDYNLEKDRWEGEFRASNPGEYLFKIFIDELGDPIQIGKFNVLESQIELSQVYLNQKLLTEISEKTKGEYYHWDDKDKLINSIEPKFRRSLKADVIKLTQSRFVLFVIILILFVEWFTRRKNGLI